MKYVNLGRSGLKVSRLCLGCMSYGEPERLPQPWSLDEKASRPLIRQALEAGINFFDTANIYSGGSSEEITGKALREMARRDEIVVATKTFFPWRNSPNTGFLSRKAIFQSIDCGNDLQLNSSGSQIVKTLLGDQAQEMTGRGD